MQTRRKLHFFLLSFLRAKKKDKNGFVSPQAVDSMLSVSHWDAGWWCALFHLSWDVVPRHPMKNCTFNARKVRRWSRPDLFLASLHCSNVKGDLGDNQGQDNQSGSFPSGGKSQGDILHSASGRRGCGVFSIQFSSLLCPTCTAQPNQQFKATKEILLRQTPELLIS